MHRSLASSASALAFSVVAVFAGCSSGGGGGGNKGAPSDGGGSDALLHKDTGNGAVPDSGGSSSGGGDAGGGTCPDNTSFKPVAYASVTAHKGVCTKSDIAAFVAACGDNGTNTTCGQWQAANADPDGGTACGKCILDPNNAGATWADQMGFFGPNYAGCVQLTDTTNGPACAAALDAANDCLGFECDSCTDQTSLDACGSTVSTGTCKQYVDTEKTACAADLVDGGAGSTCSPGSASGKLDPDFTYIAQLICGSADGG